jgi:hypothetical protein
MKRLLLSLVALGGIGLFTSSAMAGAPCAVPVRVVHPEFHRAVDRVVVVRPPVVHRVYQWRHECYVRDHCGPRGWHRR